MLAFDLDRAVLDVETVVQQGPGIFEKHIRIIRLPGHDMRRQRGLGRAQRPDVEIVNRVDPLQRSQRKLNLVDVDTLGNAGERHPHRFLQQADAAPQDDDGDG